MKVQIFATRVSSSGDGVKIPARMIPAPLPQRHKNTACRPNCGNGTIIPASGTELRCTHGTVAPRSSPLGEAAESAVVDELGLSHKQRRRLVVQELPGKVRAAAVSAAIESGLRRSQCRILW